MEILARGLCLFGDNAYLNTLYMATPLSNTSGRPKDNYNFYHSQSRIQIECVFGMLVQRWGIFTYGNANEHYCEEDNCSGLLFGKTTQLICIDEVNLACDV